MLRSFLDNWWAIALRGALAVLFGLMALIWPGITLGALILLYGVFVLADGILAVIGLIAGPRREAWWVQLLWGLLSIAAGLVALFWPGITALALLVVIASWAIVTGVLEVAAAIRLRREIENEWLLGLAGAASVLLGIVFLVAPSAGILSLVWLLGIYALVFGALLIAFGFRLRGWRNRMRDFSARV